MGAGASQEALVEDQEIGFASIIGGALNYKSWLDERMVPSSSSSSSPLYSFPVSSPISSE